MNSNVQIFGRTVENGRIAIRVNEDGYMDTSSVLNDGNGNFMKINADGSLNVDSTPNLSPPNINVLLGSDASLLLQATSSPTATADPQNGRKGWYYTNYDGVSSSLKMMWFIFDGTSTTYTVGNLKQISSVLTRDIVGNAEAPFFVIYTKPTGVDDHIPGFAHSSRVYQPQQKPIFGEKHCMYWSSDNSVPVNNDNLLLLYAEQGNTDGVYTDEQEIAYITLQTDSGAVAGQIQNLYENFGYIINDSDPLLVASQNRVLINFDTPASGGGTSSDVNVLTIASTVKLDVNVVDIASTVDLKVNNDSLTKMSYYDAGASGTYLKAILPELTAVSNSAFTNMTFNGDKSLKVIQTNSSTSYLFGSTEFSSLNIGGYTNGINIVPFNVEAVFGVATISGTGLGVSLLIEYSADNITWYSSQTSLYMTNGVSFGASYQLGAPYIRLALGGTVDTITVNLCCK